MTPMVGVLLLAALAQGAGLEGVVRSGGSGAPVAYAQVRVVEDTLFAWTNDSGEYRLEGLHRGAWTIRVVHPGHDSLDLGVVVPGDRNVRLDVILHGRSDVEEDALAGFEPFQVQYTLPALLNSAAVSAMIQRRYPSELARQGIGGETVLWIWLDERGRVVRSRVSSSSGQPRLDSIALAISDSMQFRPARNREDPVRVIVQMPVQFTVPDTGESLATTLPPPGQ